jgi:hypothetical protein
MNRVSKSIICATFLLACGFTIWPQAASAFFQQPKVDFKRDIEPIFAAACVQCHGPKKAAGQLRLDTKQAALKGGISGTIITPGDVKASRLLARILGEGGEQRMPLGSDPLKPEQIELIKRWIAEGAVWPGEASDLRPQTSDLPQHWAYVKPVQVAFPEVKNKAWVRNAVDAFILARLEKEGLQPMPEADRAVLLRRVYLDLTGLPPSVKDVDAFLADKAPDAYEKVVDRLLASPQYGERWARPWLDLARYADSNGYEKDNLRVMWKYRDWVINALNQDKPFDQFTIEQIAGDMLPNPTLDQKIATGFHRNTMVNQEGGIDPFEARWETIVDRVNTTSTVWLGSTLSCAQCHNHKYDPFTQKDYYRLFAFFENAEYEIAYQSVNKEEFTRYVLEPQLDLPTPEQEIKRKTINTEIQQLEAQMKAPTAEASTAQTQWERELAAEPQRWTPLEIISAKSSGGATLSKQADQSWLVSGAQSEYDDYTLHAKTTLTKVTGLRLEAIPDRSLPQGGPGRDPYGNFLLTGIEVFLSTGGQQQKVVLKDVRVDDAAIRPDTKDFFIDKRSNTVTDRPSGWFINATADEGERLTRQAVLIPATSLTLPVPAVLIIKLKHQGGSLCQSIGRFRLSATDAANPAQIVNVSATQRRWLEMLAAQRTAKQQETLTDRFRSSAPLFKATRDRLEKLRDELKTLNITTALVMGEKKSYERPSTFIRERGNFMNKGEQVFAAVPSVLPPLPDNAPANRLGLALWLVNENNPLTARVAVNRFWEQIFGRGIVETSEDFGSQAAPPSHLELLDWLAVEFMKPAEKNGFGWSMKKLVRALVTSSAYRQTSNATPALLEKDPYNRLLARGPRFRLEAEMLRDNALAVSGLLTRKIGGPSVMPLQPDGIWKAPYSSEKWQVSKGDDRYRRGLYTFVRRSSPHPMMLNFDGVSREFCTVRRTRTNTPLQALNALNDEAMFEASRALAQRMLNEASGDARIRAAYGLRLCVARQPKAAELDRLATLYQQQLDYFNAHAAEAERVVKQQIKPTSNCSTAEMAAWTLVANVLLNLDETLTKQ